jgi:hypothetical protein
MMRDMTAKELRAALERRGWRKVLLWIDIGGGRSIGMVAIGGKINRRASLAHAIREASAIYRLTVDEGGKKHEQRFYGYADAVAAFRGAEERPGVAAAYVDKLRDHVPPVRMLQFEPKKAREGA